MMGMQKNWSVVLVLAGAVAVTAPAAAQTVYFGENLTPAGGVSGAPVVARNNFLAQLSGVSTESFEGFAQGAQPSSLNFNGSAGMITASFAPSSGVVCAASNCNGPGRYATDGTHYFDSSSNFAATFSTPIAAFGFYGTDIGDFGGQLTITLTRVSGPSTTYTVNNTVNGPNGSLLFWGIINLANPFTGVQFGDTKSGTDFFGFDQLTVGDVRQVTGGVPEPSTWALMLVGFAGIGYSMRRKARATIAFA